jgi:hypothetical protein
MPEHLVKRFFKNIFDLNQYLFLLICYDALMTKTLDKILGPGNTTLELLPAYGRTYNTEADAIQSWCDGKDWGHYSGPYCSIRDMDIIKQTGYTRIVLRWNYKYNNSFTINLNLGE